MSTVRIGVLTSGGDAQGMNAAVRAVVRTALAKGAQPYAILEGWQGACDGGDSIKKMGWSDVSSILAEGGTVIGTARSAEFRTYEGRHRSAANLLEHGIDHLVVIGGDGSLSGTNEFRKEWPQHVAELVAEGAHDRDGNELSTQLVADTIEERTGEDARVTILGHVQRGGTPSAYDRWMSTLLGYAAVQEILASTGEDEPVILGVRRNRITRVPLMKAVHDTRAVKDLIAAGDYAAAQASRGSSFSSMVGIYHLLSTPPQLIPEPTGDIKRVAILHAGGLAPGMNTAARVAVRLGIARGWTMLGVDGSWSGLADDRVRELSWSDVEGWAFKGGAELGTKRDIPPVEQFYALGRAIERNEIDALLVIGGMNAYLGVHAIQAETDRYPAFRIPMLLIPASIDNNLPGCELAIGTDTAINNATWAIDRIKESAAASKRCFIAETMGRRCGYLTFMSALSSGAEYMYINEESPSLQQIAADAERMVSSFKSGRRLFLTLVNESASQYYDRDFLADVFNAESEGIYDVRHQALGHMQQGGAPSPYDRLLATRLVARAFDQLVGQFERGDRGAYYIGQVGNAVEARPVKRMFDDLDIDNRRPFAQWWLDLVPVQRIVSLQNPGIEATPIPIDDPVE